ncbi:MAG: Xaa-Pro peptidase family protein [Spirochaetes bacterium]|nr:Xaa-Pro peptidase family protein [Spirochaetota bacterium]
MPETVTKQELLQRIENLYKAAKIINKDFDAILIIDKVNHYYFTATMQDGLFLLKNDGSYVYFVRKSFERAKLESPLDNIFPMTSYKDVFSKTGNIKQVFLETNIVTLNTLDRMKKYFALENILPVENVILKLRAVKSQFELSQIYSSAERHKKLMDIEIPSLLKEGMSEAELTSKIYTKMIELGYQGLSRFSRFHAEFVAGQIAFSENSIFPTSFDGPGGMKGAHPAAPVLGDRNRFLKKGDLVFVDIGFGYNGYHTDRTQVYMYKSLPGKELVAAHKTCMEIQKKTASMFKPGAIPGEIYNKIISDIPADFLKNFMGMGKEQVKFLGHGVGLHIDEYPVIAKGFDAPLEENMVIALEPKKAIENIGMVGVEDTYIVTKDGGRCITGGEKEIMVV